MFWLSGTGLWSMQPSLGESFFSFISFSVPLTRDKADRKVPSPDRLVVPDATYRHFSDVRWWKGLLRVIKYIWNTWSLKLEKGVCLSFHHRKPKAYFCWDMADVCRGHGRASADDSRHWNVKQLPERVERPVGWMQTGPECIQSAPGNIIMSSGRGQRRGWNCHC